MRVYPALIIFLWPNRKGIGRITTRYSENTERKPEPLEEKNNEDLQKPYPHQLYN